MGIYQSFSSSREIRSVLESQCLHLRSNCPRDINRVILTGGASNNTDIRSVQTHSSIFNFFFVLYLTECLIDSPPSQMIGDVFGRDVYTAPVADSAAQGGAKRARYGIYPCMISLHPIYSTQYSRCTVLCLLHS